MVTANLDLTIMLYMYQILAVLAGMKQMPGTSLPLNLYLKQPFESNTCHR